MKTWHDSFIIFWKRNWKAKKNWISLLQPFSHDNAFWVFFPVSIVKTSSWIVALENVVKLRKNLFLGTLNARVVIPLLMSYCSCKFLVLVLFRFSRYRLELSFLKMLQNSIYKKSIYFGAFYCVAKLQRKNSFVFLYNSISGVAFSS